MTREHEGRARQNAGTVAAPAGLVADLHEASPASANVTVFRCVNNCSRPFSFLTSAPTAVRLPSEPRSPVAVHEIALPCAGRLQPEHLLKAFEAGADAVCVITCARDSCRYLEGSLRAERRAEYVKKLLDDIGLGRERLLLFDLVEQNGPTPTRANQNEDGSRPEEIRDALLARLGALQPNPLRQAAARQERLPA